MIAVLAAFPVEAQPAKGAAAAFERVREVMTSRFKDIKLAGDPDKDFATMLIAHHEDLIFLAKTQLEYGGDREMRQLAQKLLDAQQREIDDLKQWQVRMRQPDYRAQPDQPPPGSGPLDRKVPVEVAQAPSAPAQPAPARAGAAQDLPMVSGTVEKVDAAAGKITIDHGPIPNLDMDSDDDGFPCSGRGHAQGGEATRQDPFHRGPGEWADHHHEDPAGTMTQVLIAPALRPYAVRPEHQMRAEPALDAILNMTALIAAFYRDLRKLSLFRRPRVLAEVCGHPRALFGSSQSGCRRSPPGCETDGPRSAARLPGP